MEKNSSKQADQFVLSLSFAVVSIYLIKNHSEQSIRLCLLSFLEECFARRSTPMFVLFSFVLELVILWVSFLIKSKSKEKP